MKYRLRLIKGLSYTGIISASKGSPEVVVEDKTVVDAAIETGYFSLAESIDDQQDTPSSEENLSDATVMQLKEIAENNNIDVSGISKKADLVDTIKAALGQQ